MVPNCSTYVYIYVQIHEGTSSRHYLFNQNYLSNPLLAFGWFQIAASIGFWEIFGWQQTEGGNPGDFGYGMC